MRWPLFSKRAQAQVLPETSATSSTRFSFRLLRELKSTSGVANTFFSPASILLCLGMLHEGAAGETRQAIARALQVTGLEPEKFRLMIAALRSSLRMREPALQLEVANSLWCDHKLQVNPEFIKEVITAYESEVRVIELGGPGAVAEINSWVSEKTHGKIQNVINNLDSLTSLVAINAIYFKDLWRVPFETADTRDETFHTSNDRQVKVPLMIQFGSYSYYEEKIFQAVRIPYRTSRLSMSVFLPAEGSSLVSFLQHFDSGAWDHCTHNFDEVPGLLRVPRFKLEYGANLKTALTNLGMGIAFDSESAQFDGIHVPPPATWIDQVRHQAYIEVTESGTEAAAATAAIPMTMASMKARPTRTFRMIVDRPFFFTICDNSTDTILFMGAIEDPTAY